MGCLKNIQDINCNQGILLSKLSYKPSQGKGSNNSCIPLSIPILDSTCSIAGSIVPGDEGQVLAMVKDPDCDGLVPKFTTLGQDNGGIEASQINGLCEEVKVCINNYSDIIESKHIIDGSIRGRDLADNILDTNKYKNNSITREKLSASLLSEINSGIQDGAVTNEKITGPIDGSKIDFSTADESFCIKVETCISQSNNLIKESQLSDGAVTNSKIANGAVTNEKITGPIDGSKIDFSNVGSDFCTAVNNCFSIPDFNLNCNEVRDCISSTSNFNNGQILGKDSNGDLTGIDLPTQEASSKIYKSFFVDDSSRTINLGGILPDGKASIASYNIRRIKGADIWGNLYIKYKGNGSSPLGSAFVARIDLSPGAGAITTDPKFTQLAVRPNDQYDDEEYSPGVNLPFHFPGFLEAGVTFSGRPDASISTFDVGDTFKVSINLQAASRTFFQQGVDNTTRTGPAQDLTILGFTLAVYQAKTFTP